MIKQRPILLRLLLALGSCLLTLLLVIGGVELTVDRRTDLYPSVTTDPVSGVLINLPHQDRAVSATNFTKDGPKPFAYRVVTDQYGRRVATPRGAGDAGETVVAVVGDSYSFGSHAGWEETIAGRLEKALPDVAVTNFAVPGSCSASYPALLESYSRRCNLRPSYVVVGLYTDPALGDVPRFRARKTFGPYREIDGYPVSPQTYDSARSLPGLLAFRVRTRALKHSSLYNMMAAAGNEQFAVATPKPDYEMAATLLSHLEELRKVAELPAGSVIVHLIPSAGEVTRRVQNPDVSRTPNELFWDEIAARLKRSGFKVCDSRKPMETYLAETKSYPFTRDTHLNGQGFSVVVSEIQPKLESLLRK